MIEREPDLQTLFLVHEVEHGLNPEIHSGLYARLLGGDCE